MKNLNRFLKDDSGATMIEYALLAALIAVVCITAITNLGTAVSGKFVAISTAL
ncbi:Flp family type IVb pilin [Candidatus Bealeia paramacronuclearis]|uniref:Flp family type IVb pilin n=1 Tax=Candidatus Bealeia paramacronuclearis TaxID=1921001 RepID=A0ABZ2C380_9PROT|nr:Flp family type IVb pilin [Candidatus Bealeia paramacronuclearis]